MQESHAAGRKTGKAETELEAQLAAFSQQAVKSLEAEQIGDAIVLAKTSAKLATALAKLNGRFDHNISIRRLEKAVPETALVVDGQPHALSAPMAPSYEGEPPLFTKEEWDSDTLTNEILWQREEARKEERARRAGWL